MAESRALVFSTPQINVGASVLTRAALGKDQCGHREAHDFSRAISSQKKPGFSP
jgi:hypothetical protein